MVQKRSHYSQNHSRIMHLGGLKVEVLVVFLSVRLQPLHAMAIFTPEMHIESASVFYIGSSRFVRAVSTFY